MSISSAGGAATYHSPGDMARAGEREKEDNWSEAIRRARLAGRDESRVQFVPGQASRGETFG